MCSIVKPIILRYRAVVYSIRAGPGSLVATSSKYEPAWLTGRTPASRPLRRPECLTLHKHIPGPSTPPSPARVAALPDPRWSPSPSLSGDWASPPGERGSPHVRVLANLDAHCCRCPLLHAPAAPLSPRCSFSSHHSTSAGVCRSPFCPARPVA